MRILLLDNYDSFTWNLHHLLAPHAEVDVVLNDAISVDGASRYDRIVLSPGPGLPNEAGIMMELLRALMPTHPILGVCLGMQAIVQACGGRLYNQEKVRHGVPVRCIPIEPRDVLFHDLPEAFEVGLYHSWAAALEDLPHELRVTAWSVDGVIMGLAHRELPVRGLQFHPESVLTRSGPHMIQQWLMRS